MNDAILKKYNIRFFTASDGEKMNNMNENWLSTFIYIYRPKEGLEDFIDDLDKAISGNIHLIDPLYITDFETTWFSLITPEFLEIWQEGSAKTLIPLSDMRAILVSYKAFLYPGSAK